MIVYKILIGRAHLTARPQDVSGPTKGLRRHLFTTIEVAIRPPIKSQGAATPSHVTNPRGGTPKPKQISSGGFTKATNPQSIRPAQHAQMHF